MIKIENLTKCYGQKVAVDNISFTVKKGEIVGFLGRNGAGKTTTMNILTGYISSTSGSASIEGYDILTHPLEVKKRIGYLPEQPPLYMDMLVSEYLDFCCNLKEVMPKKQKSHIEEILELVRIKDVYHRRIGNLSKGYKQRVGLAQALVGSPQVLVLDEPTVGLDPKQIIEIRKLIKKLGEKHTVILSSHILPEVADVCEKVIIIDKGKIVAEDKLDNLQKGVGETSRLLVRVAGGESLSLRTIRDIYGVKYAEAIGSKESGTYDFIIESDKENDIRRPLFNSMAKAGLPLLLIKYMDVTLEDIFLKLTEGGREIV